MTDHQAAHHEGPLPITLGSAVAPLRRSLGPQAWCAFECLAGRSTLGPEGAFAFAVASVRTLAADLGVAKNTAHRALAVLVAAGLATPEQRRRPDGTFEVGRYRLNLGDAIGLHVDGPAAPSTSDSSSSEPEPPSARPATPTPRRPRRASRPIRDADQLSLLDA